MIARYTGVGPIGERARRLSRAGAEQWRRDDRQEEADRVAWPSALEVVVVVVAAVECVRISRTPPTLAHAGRGAPSIPRPVGVSVSSARSRSSAPQQVCVFAVFGAATSRSLSADRVPYEISPFANRPSSSTSPGRRSPAFRPSSRPWYFCAKSGTNHKMLLQRQQKFVNIG